MRSTSNVLLSLFVLALTTFSVIVVWPSQPERYLPGDFWPQGKGIKVGGCERETMRLGLDLAGGAYLVLHAGPPPHYQGRLTALWGLATIVGVTLAAYFLWRKKAPVLLIAAGCVVGLLGFAVISIASDATLVGPFRVGVALISIGRGLFLVGSVILVMSLTDVSHAGLFLGIWGIVQAMAQGFGTIGGGVVRDLAQYQTGSVVLGYTIVYTGSLLLLLIVILILAFRLGKRLKVSEKKMP